MNVDAMLIWFQTFVLVYSENGNAVLHSTYFGGSGNDLATGVVLSPETGIEDIYLYGESDSPSLSGNPLNFAPMDMFTGVVWFTVVLISISLTAPRKIS